MLTPLSVLGSLLTEAARISRSARIAQSLILYSRPLPATLPPYRRSAVCTIATSGEQPDPFTATEPLPPSYCRASSPAAFASLGGLRALDPCREAAPQENGALFNYRISSSVTFIGTPISWPDGFFEHGHPSIWRTTRILLSKPAKFGPDLRGI